MDYREQRGLELATTKRPRLKDNGLWLVPSQQGSGSYVVDFQNTACSCPDFETRGGVCKHLWSVQHTLRRETTMSDGTKVTETVTVKRTYRQDWTAYNAAQVNEKASVAELLHALCSGIVTPPQATGRPRLPLKDVVFAAGMKVYLTTSGRRASTDFRDLAARGFMEKAPHYNSIFGYMEDTRLAPLLKGLIEESANPLRAVEQDFAVDASCFSTSGKDNWFEAKHEGAKQRRKFLKCHLMVGVKTHVVTSVEVTEGSANDSPYLPGLVDATAKRFALSEVSADKGYLAASNFEAIEKTGAAAYVPFKLNSQGETGSEAWRRLYHYFSMEREKFMAHYHKRSNVESVFSMIKAKFGAAIRSKSDPAQRNEVLLKVLMHNLCCLVQAAHELGVQSSFWTGEVA